MNNAPSSFVCPVGHNRWPHPKTENLKNYCLLPKIGNTSARGCNLGVLWSLRASCDLEVNPQKSPAASEFFAAGEAKNPAISAAAMVANLLAATMVTAILRCDFCAAKVATLTF